jgi:hypothetical protein
MVFELQASRKARIIAVVLLLTLLYALWIALNSHLRGGLVSVTGALILSVVFYFWLAPAHSIGTLRIAADRCYIGEKIIGALVSNTYACDFLTAGAIVMSLCFLTALVVRNTKPSFAI